MPMTTQLLAAALTDRPFVFYHCGCRDDANRYLPEDLPEGWEEVW